MPCLEEPSHGRAAPARKVLLIGWDAADWKMISPLVDAGMMPTLGGMIDRGAMGNLASLSPILSPILWTSIGTGKRPDKHGILSFAEPIPEGGGVRLVSSTSRKTKAIWNILSQQGLDTHAVGWYASHPAEPIHGVCVSDRFADLAGPLGQPWPLAPGCVYPPSLTQSLADLRVHPGDMEAPHLLPFIPRLAEIDLRQDRRPELLSRLLAKCASVHAAATAILEKEPWDFLAVYYEAIDTAGHYFMPYHPPRLPHVSEEDYGRYQGVMTGIYRFHDMLLARLLELAGPEATVMLVSDHGFHSDHLRPPTEATTITEEAAQWHRPYGIFCLHGPGVVQDERIYGASLLDVTPTVLTLLGLPVGEDMDGKVLVQALKAEVAIERIPSWDAVPGEAGLHPPEHRQDPFTAHEALKHLVDLGYVAPPSGDEAKDVETAVREARFNLATAHLDARRPDQALPLLEALYQARPETDRYAVALAHCLCTIGRTAESRHLLEERRGQGGVPPEADLVLGMALFAEGETEAALERLRRAEMAQPTLPNLHCQIGDVYLAQKLYPSAEQAFGKALEIDGDSAHAHHGLAMAMLGLQRWEEAAEHALRAVGLLHFYPLAHYHLGVALVRLGWYDRAIEALEVAVSMQPAMVNGHRYLASIHRKLGDREKAQCHRRIAEALLAQQRRAVTVQG
jgi:Tfp pilus assembly protein PilF/arylsulfatase A-like enzyme